MLSLHVLSHLLGFIETKKLAGIVDEHVEMPEEASTQKPTNLRVKSLDLCQALDNSHGPSDGETHAKFTFPSINCRILGSRFLSQSHYSGAFKAPSCSCDARNSRCHICLFA